MAVDVSKRTDWEEMAKQIRVLVKRLNQKPKKNGFVCAPGGILNAYREGDLSHNQAVRELGHWKDRELSSQGS